MPTPSTPVGNRIERAMARDGRGISVVGKPVLGHSRRTPPVSWATPSIRIGSPCPDRANVCLALSGVRRHHPSDRQALLGVIALDFKVEWRGDVLRLTGELDMAAIERFEAAALLVMDHSDLIIDLRELAFIDSSGIRSLLKVAGEVEPRRLRLRSPGPAVRKVIDITGIADAADNLTLEL